MLIGEAKQKLIEKGYQDLVIIVDDLARWKFRSNSIDSAAVKAIIGQ